MKELSELRWHLEAAKTTWHNHMHIQKALDIVTRLEGVTRTKATRKEEKRPDRVCGSCLGRLRWNGTGYTHAGPVLKRHGAYPTEPWTDTQDQSPRA